MKHFKLCGIVTILLLLNFCNSSQEAKDLILEDSFTRSPQEAFKSFHYIFKKLKYDLHSDEFNQRYENFRRNFDEVKRWNADPNNRWKKGINQFSDMSDEEFERKILVKNMLENENLRGPPYFAANGFKYKNFIAPNVKVNTFKAVDWSKYTGAVRDQQECGSCYAQSGVNLIEATYAIKTGKSVRLSVQQVVDCNSLTSGCNGGWVTNVGMYAKANGLMLESEYPYINAQDACKYNSSTAKQYIDGMNGHGDLDAIKLKAYSAAHLYEQLKFGPASIAIDGNALKAYKSGVWTAEGCQLINHAVLVTGFGIDANNTPYFIIKNSWGTTWGESGYMRIYATEYDSAGNCFSYYFTYGAFYNGN